MIDTAIANTSQTRHNHGTVERFLKLAVRGLGPMLDRKQQLFCYRLKKDHHGMSAEGISHRYTMMTLMGLHRLQRAGTVSEFDTTAILQALLSNLEWVNNAGDLGVLLWMGSQVCPERLSEIERALQPQTALARFSDAKRGSTMELAWFLTGLSYWVQAAPEKRSQLETLAFDTYRMLTQNQGEQGFFGHLSTSKSIAGMARGRIGSFADQVYPLYAMGQFSKVYGNEEAAKRALKCALGICHAQGPKGQWWWHYDSRGGRVADGYPVFSVHQHAMAPMTLFGLGEIIQHEFDEWIYRGLQWINGQNELGFDMEDSSENVIWRCIFRSKRSLGTYVKANFGLYSDEVENQRGEDLKVLFECRPYELGWLLYAFAGRNQRHS
jgi:hypothetical protein